MSLLSNGHVYLNAAQFEIAFFHFHELKAYHVLNALLTEEEDDIKVLGLSLLILKNRDNFH